MKNPKSKQNYSLMRLLNSLTRPLRVSPNSSTKTQEPNPKITLNCGSMALVKHQRNFSYLPGTSTELELY